MGWAGARGNHRSIDRAPPEERFVVAHTRATLRVGSMARSRDLAVIRELIARDERIAERWHARYAGAFQARRIWVPQDLGVEAKPFAQRGRSLSSPALKRTDVVQGPARYDWARPESTLPSLCRTEMLAARRAAAQGTTNSPTLLPGVHASIDRPTFAENEVYHSVTSAGVIGQGAPHVQPGRPRHGRVRLDDLVTRCRNGPDARMPYVRRVA